MCLFLSCFKANESMNHIGSNSTLVSESSLYDFSELVRLFTCPGCGHKLDKAPIVQCWKGTVCHPNDVSFVCTESRSTVDDHLFVIAGHVACIECCSKMKGVCPSPGCRQRMTLERNVWMENAAKLITLSSRKLMSAEGRPNAS
jgi:hypothetical protein